MDIEVRPLIVTDVFTVARMLSKVTKGARVEIAEAIKADKKKKPDQVDSATEEITTEAPPLPIVNAPDPTELGLSIFQSMFAETEEDLKMWLASLISKTKDEFEAMPATTVIDIIEKLSTQEDIKDFFGRVSQLVSKA